jgi:hypothetical protein
MNKNFNTRNQGNVRAPKPGKYSIIKFSNGNKIMILSIFSVLILCIFNENIFLGDHCTTVNI